jgi:hypothetical protein
MLVPRAEARQSEGSIAYTTGKDVEEIADYGKKRGGRGKGINRMIVKHKGHIASKTIRTASLAALFILCKRRSTVMIGF